MTIETIPAREIREGDVILAESPRYNGPDVRVTSVEVIAYGRPFNIAPSISFGVERMSGNPTRLSGVPLDKPYRVERAS